MRRFWYRASIPIGTTVRASASAATAERQFSQVQDVTAVRTMMRDCLGSAGAALPSGCHVDYVNDFVNETRRNAQYRMKQTILI
jgi:hypothetical protein